MPIVAIDLTDEEAARVDLIADKEKRVRKAQAHVLLMERVSEIEADSLQTSTPAAKS